LRRNTNALENAGLDEFMNRCEGMCLRIRYGNSSVTAWSAPLNRDPNLTLSNLENVPLGVSSAIGSRNVVSTDKIKRSGPIMLEDLVAPDAKPPS